MTRSIRFPPADVRSRSRQARPLFRSWTRSAQANGSSTRSTSCPRASQRVAQRLGQHLGPAIGEGHLGGADARSASASTGSGVSRAAAAPGRSGARPSPGAAAPASPAPARGPGCSRLGGLVEGVLLLQDRPHVPLHEEMEERLAREDDPPPEDRPRRERGSAPGCTPWRSARRA